VFSPRPYNEASFGSCVDISKYWSLNTITPNELDPSELELKRVCPFDFLLTEKLKGSAM
jgi:hypothetical protein